MRSPLAALIALALPLPALGQQVIVRTDPPRATLVCDGRVVGVTPVAFDPSRVRTCTLFARGHANLAFDPAELTGAIASYRLQPVDPRDGVPCGNIDPRTGLMRVCFPADGERPPRAPPPPSVPLPSPPYGTGCGQIDPHTGLMNVCFDEQRAPRPRTRPSPPPPRPEPCGRLDPRTGLFRPCF